VKRAIVTGAGGAIGSTLVTTLRSRGWEVVGLDLVAADGVLACDVTSEDSVRSAVAEAIAQLGGLDALVNNAGLGGPASAGTMPDDHVLRMVDVNLFGAWRTTAAAIDALVSSRGQVVFVGSRMAFLGLPLGAAYGVSKRGLTAYADALRAEYATHVGVTCVHPAFIRTPIHDRTREAGLNLEGFSREEPLEGVVAKIVAACEGDGGRDVAITRGGAAQLFAARHLPKVVDRVVAKTLRKRVAAGELDSAPIAAGVRARHGRT
jgi:NAD(P)-dependent dehydrogenase (short-subunit alcohol dehydrogenase family)